MNPWIIWQCYLFRGGSSVQVGVKGDQQNMGQWHCLQSNVSPLDATKSNISAGNVDLILSLLFQQNRLSRKQDCDSGVSVCQGWGEKQHVFQVRALISSESPLPFPLWVKLWRLTQRGVTLHYSFIFCYSIPRIVLYSRTRFDKKTGCSCL